MKKYRRLLISCLFLVVSAVFIALYTGFHYFIPAQQVELSHGIQYGAVLKDFLFVQEITMKQRYLSRVDVYMAKLPSPVVNSNVFVLIDDQQRILFTKRFSSDDFGEALHFPFIFGKVFDIGAGKKVYACIYSTDGDQQSYIGLARKDGSKLGKLYVIPVQQGDVLQSFVNRQSVVDFPGTLGVRTYESGTRFFSLFQVVMYIIALIIAVLIFTWPLLFPVVSKIRFRPEFVFLTIASVFGIAMLVITPPFQVPDEPVHFYRSWQLTELNLFKIKDDIPQALVTFADTCKRMKFSTHEKTSVTEIISMAGIETDKNDRIYNETTNYIIPYLPQAIGISIGKLLNLSLLWIFYLSRMFNLIVAVFLVFMAIRIIPVFKWLFMMLGILPMSLYQFASLSYDASTIGLTFLLLALILRLTFSSPDKVQRGFLWIFIVSLLLATSKPPYFLIVLTFLIVPVVNVGNLKKYVIVFAGLLISVFLVSQIWEPARKLAQVLASETTSAEEKMVAFFPAEATLEHQIHRMGPLASALPLLPHTPRNAENTAASGSGNATQQANQAESSTNSQVVPVNNPINPSGQIKFILSNPFEYTGILFNTLKKSGNLYLVSLIGLFGWIDTQVPDWLAYFNLLMLILLAFLLPVQGIGFNIRQKSILLLTFLTCFILIETALYLYCNPVGSQAIIAVQGRYFIAISPLLFMLFYSSSNILRFFKPSLATDQPNKGRKPSKNSRVENHQRSIENLHYLLPFAAVLLGLVTLSWSVCLIIDRFYVLHI